MAKSNVFLKVLSEAIKDVVKHGFDSQERMDKWLANLRLAANASILSVDESSSIVARGLNKLFGRYFKTKKKPHKGLDVDLIIPQYRPILDRRIMASVNLIKLNRDQAIEMSLRRFSGWMSSVPIGGSAEIELSKVKKHIWKPLQSSSYEDRRLLIDQGHKMLANINATVADQYGAIGFKWHHIAPEANYDPRPEHVKRDGHIYALRDSWAMDKGYISRSADFDTDIDMPGQEIFCRCSAHYIYSLNDLPPEMLTEKGREVAKAARLR